MNIYIISSISISRSKSSISISVFFLTMDKPVEYTMVPPLKKRQFSNIAWAVYYKQLSAFITELWEDFAKNDLTITDDNKAYVIEALKEKCDTKFPVKILPVLGEFTFSLQSDLPENVLQIIFILREVFESYNLE